MPALRLPGATYAVPVPLDSTDVPSRLISGEENSRRASISRSACRLLCEHLREPQAGWQTYGRQPKRQGVHRSSLAKTCPQSVAEESALTSQQQVTAPLTRTLRHRYFGTSLWRACARLRASCNPAPAH